MADGDPPVPFGPGAPGYGPGGAPPPGPPGEPPRPPSPPVPPPQAFPESVAALDPEPMPPGGWDQQIGRPPKPPKPGTDRLAGWGSRFAAQLIDWVVVLVPGSILGILVVGLYVDNDDVDTLAAIGVFVLFLMLLFLMLLFYGPVLMRRSGEHNGQTWGKQALGIAATRDSGEPFDFWSAALREVGLKGVALAVACTIIPVVPFFLNYLWPLWDGENRAIHDMGAETHVVRL